MRALVLCAVLSGCAGGGSASTPAAQRQSVPESVQATVSVTVPPRTQSVGRAPRYVSPSTQSMTVLVTPQVGGATTTATANCVLQQNGSNTCSTTIAAPVGPDTFTVNLYDAQNGTGNLLSSGTTNFTIVQNQTNIVALIFGGIPAAVKMSLSSPFFPRGLSGTLQLTVTEVDADNNVIVGPPTAYPSPITLQNSDTTGTVTLSRTQVASASEPPVTVTYNGSTTAPPSVTITATASGIPAAKVDSATIQIKTGTLIDVFDGALYPTASNQQFFAQNGIVQVKVRQTAGESLSLGGAIAPDGTVYIDSTDSTGRVLDVKSRDLTFLRSIGTDTSNGYVATDGGGNVYVSRTNGLKVYPPNSTSVTPPLRILNVPQSPIAVDTHGHVIALSSASSIDVYPANATGIVAPARTITAASGITFRNSVAADTADNIYVNGTLFTQPAVFVYPPTANGAASPSRYISGPHAFPDRTDAIAVDAGGYLYTCCPGFQLQSFGPTANGDAAPISTITVYGTNHSGPWSVATDPSAITNAGPP